VAAVDRLDVVRRHGGGQAPGRRTSSIVHGNGERASMTRQLSDVLAGYEDFHDFDPRELHLVEALRTLRLIHYAAWIARRWDDPAFPIAFPWFASPSYWADQCVRLREQLVAMAEPPLGSSG